LAPASALQQIGGKYYAQVLKEKTAIQTMVQAALAEPAALK